MNMKGIAYSSFYNKHAICNISGFQKESFLFYFIRIFELGLIV